MFKKKIIYIAASVIAALAFSTNSVYADVQKENDNQSASEILRSNNNSVNQQVDSSKDSESDVVNQAQSSNINTEEKNQIDSKEQENLKDDSKNKQEDVSDDEEVGKGEEDVTVNQYNDNVKNFQQVNMNQVKDILTEKDNQDRIMYIGRPTCYYCRQFLPELKEFNELIDGNLLYFDIDAEDGAHEYAFKEIGIPGTPTTMRIKNSTIIAGWIGGDITAEDLYNFLYSDESNKLADSINIAETAADDNAEIESPTFDKENFDPIQESNQVEATGDDSQALESTSNLQTISQEQNNNHEVVQNDLEDSIEHVSSIKSLPENDKINVNKIDQSASLKKRHNKNESKIRLNNIKSKSIVSVPNSAKSQYVKNIKVKVKANYEKKDNTCRRNSNSSITSATAINCSKELPKTGEDYNFLMEITGLCLTLIGILLGRGMVHTKKK